MLAFPEALQALQAVNGRHAAISEARAVVASVRTKLFVLDHQHKASVGKVREWRPQARGPRVFPPRHTGTRSVVVLDGARGDDRGA